jgi:tetraacyldisaccharide 4'-kinase
MRTPAFWAKGKAPLIGFLLAPLGWLYGCGTKFRLARGTPRTSSKPVICVGNLVAGGTGKTPVVIDLAQRLKGVHVLTRGYGGSKRGPLTVDPKKHTTEQVGDESLLIASRAPAATTWIIDNRFTGCQAAVESGAEIIVFDDGFQDPAVIKDLSLIIVDGGYGFGNDHMIPAGPLREPVDTGLRRADAVVIIGEDTSHTETRIAGRCPVLHARLVPDTTTTTKKWSGQKIFAFAGIGRPEKFFETVRSLD